MLRLPAAAASGTPLATIVPTRRNVPFWDSRQRRVRMNTALVPLGSSGRERHAVSAGRGADTCFVAHLIATAVRAPQTCARCRADPQDATAAYRVRRELSDAAESGRLLSRAI